MNNIDLELYRIFYTVAKYESISKATEELYISQPAITQRINNLEKQLNIQLFYRRPGSIKLTDEGKILYGYVKSGIENMNEVETKFNNYIEQQTNNNVIRIKSANSQNNLMICNMIIPYITNNPNLSVKMYTGSEEETIDNLINGEVDIIVVSNKCKIRSKYLEVISKKELNLCFYTTQKYIMKQSNKKVDIGNKLEKYDFILPKQNCPEKQFFNSFCKSNKLNISAKYEIDSLGIRNYFVQNGLGISVRFQAIY